MEQYIKILSRCFCKGISVNSGSTVTGIFTGPNPGWDTCRIQSLDDGSVHSVETESLRWHTGMRDIEGKMIFDGDHVDAPEFGLKNAEVIWMEDKHCWAAQPESGARWIIGDPEKYLVLTKESEVETHAISENEGKKTGRPCPQPE